MAKLKSIFEDTVLIPEIIADRVTNDPVKAKELVDKAEHLYLNSEHFRKKILASGNAGRDNLYMFMQHWAGQVN